MRRAGDGDGDARERPLWWMPRCASTVFGAANEKATRLRASLRRHGRRTERTAWKATRRIGGSGGAGAGALSWHWQWQLALAQAVEGQSDGYNRRNEREARRSGAAVALRIANQRLLSSC